MRQYPVLQSIIEKNIPELQFLPSHKRKKAVKQILDENIIRILMKVRLPDPITFRFRMVREHFWDLRRRKEAKHGEKNFNYNLWRKLYEAKFNLKHNILENSDFQYEKFNDYTTLMSHKIVASTNVQLEIPKITSASSILWNINQIASNVEVSQKLQAKLATIPSYTEFVTCINGTCKSFEVEKLGFAEYLLDEKKDIENPSWEKIILDARFYERDMEKKLEKWERLREIIDESIKELKSNTETLYEIKELEKKFYINLVY